MKLGYMTNGFGPLVGSGGGVTSVKDIRYLTMCDDEAALEKITKAGFGYIEVLEGNLTQFEENPGRLIGMLERHQAGMMSVCVGGNFIYKDALEDELAHMEAVAEMAQKAGLSYLVVCGGAIRAKGIQEGDCGLLAQALDQVCDIAKCYGLTACFHPHLGSLAEKPKEIDELFEKSKIAACPDLAHLQAGGYDPLEFIKKYYDRIPLIHLKDLDENGFAPLGTGSIDIKGVIAYAKERQYTGDWLVETDGYAGDPEQACRTCYEYLKGLLV